jgi:hypothetical protein
MPHPVPDGVFFVFNSLKINPLTKTIIMKSSILVMLLAIVAITVQAQDKSKRPSPPATAEGTIGGVKIKIDYSQPSAKGRKMIGGIEPYGKVWRTGANETTSIEFSGPVKIEGKDVPKGKYGLYTIPGEAEWTIIINKDIKWGAFDYTDKSDVIRVNVKPTKTASFVETFVISVDKDQVTLKWENTQVAFKVKG